MTLYAVGDIHGQAEQLDEAIARIDADGGSAARVIFLGDLVDRGPDSRGVIDRLLEGIRAGRDWRVLMGNHDRMFLRFLAGGELHDLRIKSGKSWLTPPLGGPETLRSYGLDDLDRRPPQELQQVARDAVPAAHLEFLETLPLTHLEAGMLFVHAGIRPAVPLDRQTEDDLIWIREPFLSWQAPHPWLVVHGHSAIEYPAHCGNRINLDGGAGHGRDLIPAVFEAGAAWLLDRGGRVRL